MYTNGNYFFNIHITWFLAFYFFNICHNNFANIKLKVFFRKILENGDGDGNLCDTQNIVTLGRSGLVELVLLYKQEYIIHLLEKIGFVAA